MLDPSSWRRESFREPDEPRAWEIPEDLYDAAQSRRPHKVLWRGALSLLLGTHRCLDHRGVLVTTQERMAERTGYVLAWCRDVLGLAECEGWGRRPPDFLKPLLRSFYEQGAGDNVAVVVVESCRDFLRKRLPQFSEVPARSRRTRFWYPPSLQDKKRLYLRSKVVVPTRSLTWEVPRGRSLSETTVTEMPMVRTVRVGDVPLIGNWTCWCLATRGEDDALLRRAAIPAGLQCPISDAVNGARLMTFIKLELPSYETESYAIDVNPHTGGVISIRYVRTAFRLMAALDPWIDDWVRAVARHKRRRDGQDRNVEGN